MHFGLVWLWHVIRQFRIYLNFLQNFCVHSRSLARFAAHPQLRVPRDLKHGTVPLSGRQDGSVEFQRWPIHVVHSLESRLLTTRWTDGQLTASICLCVHVLDDVVGLVFYKQWNNKMYGPDGAHDVQLYLQFLDGACSLWSCDSVIDLRLSWSSCLWGSHNQRRRTFLSLRFIWLAVSYVGLFAI